MLASLELSRSCNAQDELFEGMDDAAQPSAAPDLEEDDLSEPFGDPWHWSDGSEGSDDLDNDSNGEDHHAMAESNNASDLSHVGDTAFAPDGAAEAGAEPNAPLVGGAPMQAEETQEQPQPPPPQEPHEPPEGPLEQPQGQALGAPPVQEQQPPPPPPPPPAPPADRGRVVRAAAIHRGACFPRWQTPWGQLVYWEEKGPLAAQLRGSRPRSLQIERSA